MKSISTSAADAPEESEDEAPTVAEIVDERPEHVRRLEEYRKNQRWKVLGKDGEQDGERERGVGQRWRMRWRERERIKREK